uniref:DNA methyltransferase n=1 Tax=Ezakiella massiliensis TaxID=1852374 RepID=UPI0009F1E723|nr:site-specific DNA-methyltransferase [Ezakiella massiliensis]
MRFLDELKDVLSKDERFIGEDNQIIKTKVSDAARDNDEKLLKALLINEFLKESLFKKIDDIYVFDINKFIWIVESKEFLPDSYTMYKNKIGLVDRNNNLISQKEDVSLVWPYKDCVLEGGQTKEDQKRDEIFYNEILAPDQVNRLLAPKVLSNAKRYTKDGFEENIEFNEDDNLIIKGNNLIALSSLLKRYGDKVKCIYIDPPYYFDEKKEEDTFLYNSNFKLSTWLNFMKNRLEVALKFLKDDGFIFVQIGDDGYAYLKVIMDEIFGNNKYINTIIVKSKASSGASGGGEDKKLKKNVEYILIYGNENSILKTQYIKTPLNKYISEREEEGKSFAYTNVMLDMGEEHYIGETVDGFGDIIKLYEMKNYKSISVKKLAEQENCSEEEIYRRYIDKIYTTENAQTSIRDRVRENVSNDVDLVIARYVPVSGKNKGKLVDVGFIGNTKRLVSYLKETVLIEGDYIYKTEKAGTLWDDISWSSVKLEGNVDFGAGKKPEKLMKRIIESSTSEGDIVMDYHIGSGTTAATAHKLGRKYIGIDQMNYIEDMAIKRLNNVIKGDSSGISKETKWLGGGSFVYCELLEDNESLVKELEDSKTSEEIKDVLNKAIDYGKLIPSVLPKDLKDTEEDFKKLSLDEQKNLVMELLNKNKLYINLSDIDDEDYNVNESDKKFTRSFYGKE